METVYDLVVVVHFLGLASLIGGWLVQMRARGERFVNPAMPSRCADTAGHRRDHRGAGESVLDREYDLAKISVKLAVTAVVLLLVWVNRRKDVIPDGSTT